MSKGVKILLSLFFIGVVVLASAIYFISTKIDPQTIRKYSIASIEKYLPGVTAQIKVIDYELGTSLKIEIKEILLNDKLDNEKLLELENISIRIPILAILTSGGVIDISTKSPLIHVVKKNKEINWNRALVAREPQKKAKKSEPIKLPSFIKRSKLNLKLEGLQVLLDLGPFKKSKVNVSRILVKNLNLKGSTAFEVNSDLNFQIEKDQFLRTKLLIIGEIFLRDLLEENKFNLISNFKIKETSIDSFLWDFPDLKGTLKTSGLKNKLESLIELSGGGLSNLKFTMHHVDDLVDISKLNLDINLKESLGHYQGFLPEIVRRTDFNKSSLNLNGKISYDMKNNKIDPQINFTIKSPFATSFYGLPKVETSLSGKLNPSNWLVDIESLLLNGKMNIQLNALAELKQYLEPMTSWPKTDVLINLDGLTVSKNYIQKLLWGPSEPAAETQGLAEKKEALSALPRVDLKIIGKKLLIGERESSLSGELQVKGYLVESQSFIFRYERGKIENKMSLLLDPDRNMELKLNSALSQIELESLNPFFPPIISEVSGSFSGKNYLSINTKEKGKFAIKSSIKASKGQIKNLNLNQFAEPVISQLRQFKVQMPPNMNFSERFETLIFKFIGNQKKITINDFRLTSATKKEKIRLKGHISLNEKSSLLVGTFYSSDLSRQLSKNFGFRELPIRLTGIGYNLTPEPKYTIRKIGAGANKKINKKIQKELVKQKKKVRKKINKRIKTETKKLEDKLKSKLKGIKL